MKRGVGRKDVFRMRQVRQLGAELEVQVDTLTGVATSRVAITVGEAPEALRQRVTAALRDVVVARERSARRGSWSETVMQGFSLELNRPGPSVINVHDGLVEGRIGERTKTMLVVLREDGVDREVVVTPNRNGRFSVSIGSAVMVSMTPVAADGLMGDVQTVEAA